MCSMNSTEIKSLFFNVHDITHFDLPASIVLYMHYIRKKMWELTAKGVLKVNILVDRACNLFNHSPVKIIINYRCIINISFVRSFVFVGNWQNYFVANTLIRQFVFHVRAAINYIFTYEYQGLLRYGCHFYYFTFKFQFKYFYIKKNIKRLFACTWENIISHCISFKFYSITIVLYLSHYNTVEKIIMF